MMQFLALALVVTAAVASPLPPVSSNANANLRLIKTSPTDPGTWLPESEKFSRFNAKDVQFVDVTDTEDLESLGAASVVALPSAPVRQSQVNPLLSNVDINNVKTWLNTYSTYHTRYYRSQTGVDAANWLFETVKSVAASNPAITVRQYTHSAFPQKSVILSWPGSNKNDTGRVVIGAHLDSVGQSQTGRSPGADDNGTGTCTILEALRVLVASDFVPTGTLEWHWYAGEEGGLLGSREIFRQYAADKVNVKAMMNQDMTGWSPKGEIGIITDFTDGELSAFVKATALEYSGAKVVETRCGYGCSDHASANSAGYKSSFAFEAAFADSNPVIHTERDTMDRLNFEHVGKHVKMTVGFAVEASYF